VSQQTPNPHSASTDILQAPLFLGIDLGTSGVRAFVIDSSERVVTQAEVQYEQAEYSAKPVQPQNWWQAVLKVLNDLQTTTQHNIACFIVSICVDGTSSSVLICDSDGQPLNETLMYFDQRAEQQASRIREIAPEHHPAAAVTSGLAKWLWLQDNTRLENDYHYLHQADWIAGKLAGKFNFSDENNALKSGYDAQNKRWPEWVKSLLTQAEALPQIQPAGKAVCKIAKSTAQQFGFAEDTLIVAGTTDSTAAVIATGACNVGDAVTSLGSTLVLKVISDGPVSDAATGIYSQPFGEHWLVGGASNSGGAVLRQFFNDQQMSEYQLQIDTNQPTQLDYYPLPAVGERFPVNDPLMTARITPRPKSDVIFFQGLLEGIANIEYQGYKKLNANGAPWPSSIRTTGGGSKNPAWNIIRQTTLNIAFLETQHSEAAYGSAVLARRGWEEHKARMKQLETSA
jgi:sugar (pentulose or hexulose) kinase